MDAPNDVFDTYGRLIGDIIVVKGGKDTNVNQWLVEQNCALLRVARSSLAYRSRLAAKDAPVAGRMRELAAQYPRYGYRRIRIFLARKGHVMETHRAHRLWRRAGLQLPRRRPRRRVAASRPRPLPPTGPNQVWAYDFVFDACAGGQQLKRLLSSFYW